MDVAHDFLTNLALVMCVAGVTTLVFQLLRQPVVFGYLLAGLIIGPHTAVPLIADEQITHTLAELGVILQAQGQVDLATAPHKAMEVTLHLMMVVVVGGLVVVITQPFLPLFRGSILFGLILVLFAVGLWRSATNLLGHTRAGAQIIAMALSKQMAEEVGDNVNADLQRVRAALPGLGEPEPVTVPAGAVANGRTLGDIDLRGATGATVLAIVRKGGEEVLLPNGHESLAEGDVVFLAGTQNAINAARSIPRSPIHNQAARAHRLNKH